MADDPLEGKLEGARVRLGGEAVSELYDQGYFGRRSASGLDLTLVEAVYLLDRGKIRVHGKEGFCSFQELMKRASALEKGLEFKYVVYKDLRERGYYVAPGVPDFRVYPRGGHPGKTPAEFYVWVVSERTPIPLCAVLDPVTVAGHVRKRLMLAVVDEESDITYYEAREKTLSGNMEEPSVKADATLLADRVVLWDPSSSDQLHNMGFFGNTVGGRLQLSLVESAYLLETGRISISDRSGKPLDMPSFLEIAGRIESDFQLKYSIYRDLRKRRLVVKTGFKFGTHFRVYKEVLSTKKVPHSEYLIHAALSDQVFSLPVISRAVRLAHSVRKQMVFGLADGTPRYLEIRRIKP
jgi:tRNA-intron endonuclease